MSLNSNHIYLCVCFIFLQSCYSLSNISTLKLEIVVPGSVRIPTEYKNVAVRFNNANVSLNPNFAEYRENNLAFTDSSNLDSIASEIYFQQFVSQLNLQQFFDSIIEVKPKDYSDIVLNDSLVYAQFKIDEPADSGKMISINPEVVLFTKLVGRYINSDQSKSQTNFIDPEFSLYSKNDIQQIADSTDADLLLSFDYFASTDGIFSANYLRTLPGIFIDYNEREVTELVYVVTAWSFFDLQKQELIYTHLKTDTIKWNELAYNIQKAKRILPPRRDAVLNAADIAGSRFAEHLAPHWIEVERMYYKSGQIELKKTNDLIKQNQWLEAAEIWKKNTTNKNKKIAAKSMFNMALACEMNGNMDAAIDWAVKSFYARQKDIYHTANCQSYIFILGQRKLDIKKIEGE